MHTVRTRQRSCHVPAAPLRRATERLRQVLPALSSNRLGQLRQGVPAALSSNRLGQPRQGVPAGLRPAGLSPHGRATGRSHRRNGRKPEPAGVSAAVFRHCPAGRFVPAAINLPAVRPSDGCQFAVPPALFPVRHRRRYTRLPSAVPGLRHGRREAGAVPRAVPAAHHGRLPAGRCLPAAAVRLSHAAGRIGDRRQWPAGDGLLPPAVLGRARQPGKLLSSPAAAV